MNYQNIEIADGFDLDAMLTREEAAKWLRMSKREMSLKSAGQRPIIPAFRLSRQMVRYHPRTILAKLAKDAGVPLDLIAASYGYPLKPPQK